MLNELMYSTIRIDINVDNNEYRTATGTLIKASIEDEHKYAVLTNSHIFMTNKLFPINFIEAIFYIWIKDSLGVKKCVEFVLNGSNKNKVCFYSEPFGSDKFIDLCAIDVINLFTNEKKYTFYNPIIIDNDYIVKGLGAVHSLEIGTNILMIGYPSGRFDKESKLPICRTGYIASNPKLHFNGEEKFLIDIKTLEGNSGSPIFFSVSNIYRNDLKNDGRLIRDLIDIRFLGIFTEYMKDDLKLNSGEIVSNSLDLGFVIKPNVINLIKLKVFGLLDALERLTGD